MCGIVGIKWKVDPPANITDVVGEMLRAIGHRGPDSEGRVLSQFLDVGFRRLSIIDLETGTQPLPNEDGTIECFLNGEIFNYKSLRQELMAKGHTFRTSSDTEVLPHMYEEYDASMFSRLNGMFSICVIDHTKAEVFLARDRIGVKQMYYRDFEHGTVFGSELKALLASGLFNPKLDKRNVLAYLSLFYCPSPNTLIDGVKKLEPGCYIRLTRPQPDLCQRKYDEPLGRRIATGINEQDYQDQLVNLLQNAVDLQLEADVRVGLSLSGGVDSSALALAASRSSRPKPLALTVTFPDTPEDEKASAKSICRHLGLDHILLSPTTDEVLNDLPMLAWLSDEPIADPALYSQYAIARVASEHVKVLLSGAGGDELFGGYSRYFVSNKYRLLSLLPNQIRLTLEQCGLFPRIGTRRMEAIREFDRNRSLWHAEAIDNLGPDLQQILLEQTPTSINPFDKFNHIYQEYLGRDHYNRQMLIDLHTYLPDQILPMIDRATMGASIEGRVPLLDVELVEFCLSLPSQAKIGKRPKPKRLLKQVLNGHIPQSILNRKKTGLPNPVMLLLEQEYCNMVPRILLGADSIATKIFPVQWIRRALVNKKSVRQFYRILYPLILLEVWHNLFLRRKIFNRPTYSIEDLYEPLVKMPSV